MTPTAIIGLVRPAKVTVSWLHDGPPPKEGPRHCAVSRGVIRRPKILDAAVYRVSTRATVSGTRSMSRILGPLFESLSKSFQLGNNLLMTMEFGSFLTFGNEAQCRHLRGQVHNATMFMLVRARLHTSVVVIRPLWEKAIGKMFSLSRKLDQLTVIDSSFDNKWYDDAGNTRCLAGSSSAGSLRMSPFTFQELDHACRLVKVPPALSRLREERRVILG